jgi:hypothetical protein
LKIENCNWYFAGESFCSRCSDENYTSRSAGCNSITNQLTSLPYEITSTVSEIQATKSESLKLGISSSSLQVFVLCQFKAQYQLSEVTNIVRSKMIIAVSNVLEVNTSTVVLDLTSTILRRRTLLQQAGVLVSVGLTNMHQPASIFTARITQERLNAEMAAQGLKSVQLLITNSAGRHP